MATTSYTWAANNYDDIINSLAIPADVLSPAVAGNAAGTQYFVAWTSTTADTGVAGRLINTTGGEPAEFPVSPPAPELQYDPSVAALADGRFVVTYTDKDFHYDPGGDVRARLFNADGTAAGSIGVFNALDDDEADVAALADGGFAVTWTRHMGAGNNDIVANVYNADLTVRSQFIGVSTNPNNASQSSVAGLAGGGFVVVWEESPAAGGDTEVRFSRFNAAGGPVGLQNVLIDTTGSINRDIQVKALPDGGFVVAYVDSGWGNGTDITARVYNADGTTRSNFLHVNNDGVAGDQVAPTLAVMPNGYFAVGWLNESNAVQRVQAYDNLGNEILNNIGGIADHSTGGKLAAVGDKLVMVWANPLDGDGNLVKAKEFALSRSIVGTDGGETILGQNDFIPEIIVGGSGDDILEGRNGRDILHGNTGNDLASYSMAPSGVVASLANPAINTGDAAGDTYAFIDGLIGSAFNDTLAGNGKNNTLHGGAGDDTAVFSGTLASYTVKDFGSLVIVSGLDGPVEPETDTLNSIEHLQFADAILNVGDDGNPMFDALYYLSQNPDVFAAGVDPLDHFNAHGWHEGRNPNAYFDTSGYLAVNKDVAAAGVNPLDHYHNSGWHEGRDPSADFDTTLYLIHNPDVAAAGIDPLAHFLASGMAEGRSAYAAVGQDIASGFDAQYYLFHNPDVAAAGVDPLFHFNVVGWQEGRNPNRYFDTAGYLSQYSDVAAAGVNPLDHYMTTGWHEGRDSSYFETNAYLAAYPDVAAAGINPLDHFLTHGIYEGRQSFGETI